MFANIPNGPKIYGLAGLLPPAFLALCVLFGPVTWQWSALAIGYGYAALIFSFLGGFWWGLGVSRERAPSWIFAAAVAPSLIALATYVPWILGWSWPGPSMLLLGLCIGASPFVDERLGQQGYMPKWMLQLRWLLSIGLGVLTLLLGFMALNLTP